MNNSKEESFPIIAVLFSMNRAMQLEAALRSFFRHCLDADRCDVVIIYKTSSPDQARQYRELAEEVGHAGRIQFHQENNFRRDLLDLLFDASSVNRQINWYKAAVRVCWLFGRLRSRWLRPVSSRYILFMVDDNIFVRDFYLSEALDALWLHTNALGFSLRLGKNTIYCYTHAQSQGLPQFDLVSPGVLKFDWTEGEKDFHYPLEVSGSIYRLNEILPLVSRLRFRNPNQLESRMAAHSKRFAMSHPKLLCFERSVAFCNPVNRVQQIEKNRAGRKISYAIDELVEKFDSGMRIDIKAYDGFIPNSCHQEVEFRFVKRGD